MIEFNTIIWICIIAILIIRAVAGYAWTALSWTLSYGERAGYIQNFSRKGWICKTWEGELQMIPAPGAIPDKFLFSVRDDEIAGKINVLTGKKVTLHYEQHIGVPTTCFGETGYFVTDVKAL